MAIRDLSAVVATRLAFADASVVQAIAQLEQKTVSEAIREILVPAARSKLAQIAVTEAEGPPGE